MPIQKADLISRQYITLRTHKPYNHMFCTDQNRVSGTLSVLCLHAVLLYDATLLLQNSFQYVYNKLTVCLSCTYCSILLIYMYI